MGPIAAPRAAFSDFIVRQIIVGRCADFFPAQNTKGNALSVPLECCLLGFSDRYFFFAAFLAVFLAFFAGFLAAFLVAIFLFSLFDGLHRFCN